ncbi:metal-dependent hydrolase [Halobacillus naozhouensis]|uniref:Metal-dependent hydrolase n=1 Tax=Halobacillus naozhouensis TaxID=554880 RepID=A0ABY8IYD4_9BACI|nr:metal-dependent hydrolase [Halobacillus naozhouensis]WFT75225.1 metal-dependent hydrolase [Halobacillus naozhouensis]
MMASGHQVVGFTCGVATLTFLPELVRLPTTSFETTLFFLFVLFGSLLPDIDTPRSTLGKWFWRLLLIFLLGAVSAYLLVPVIINEYRDELSIVSMFILPILIMVRSHRKMTHSILFIFLIGGYCYFIGYFLAVPLNYFIGLLVGVCSHLLGDVITKKGIPILYPFSKKHFRFIVTFKTGSLTEKFIVMTLAVANLCFLVIHVL